MDISKIDKNFRSYYSFQGMKTFNVNESPFTLHGLCRDADGTDFKRLPHEVVNSFDNNAIKSLYKNTSGIRVRFMTDSKRIILKCVLPKVYHSSTMPQTASSCFDLYADGEYCAVFRPAINIDGKFSGDTMGENGYTSGHVFPDKKMREILVHFPLYNDVDEVYIALEEDAQLCPPQKYKIAEPVVFYGSSITQGGCASHPGNSYPAMISRRLDCDFINLGFSAGCLAEKEMCDYISTIKKSMVVYDYDHNAENAQFLEQTHEKFFLRLREQNPLVPVVIVSAADCCFGKEGREERKQIIRKTYENAVAKGDENVYFIDGSKFYDEVGADYCTVDTTHPNDLGFYCMANEIGKVIEKILNRRNVL